MRRAIVWLQYGCWCIHWWMEMHKPRMPQRIQVWAIRRYGSRYWAHTMPPMVQWWFGTQRPYYPPFLRAWLWIARQFRKHTGGRSHRCEFTDPQKGALWGHTEGAFMDRAFARFLQRIDADSDGEE